MLEDILQILLNHSKRHGNKPASFFIWKKAPSCKLNTVMPSTVSSSDARLPDQVFACLEPNEEPRLSAVGSTAAGMLQPCFQEAGGFTGGGLSSFCACLWQPGGEQTPTPPQTYPPGPRHPAMHSTLKCFLSLSPVCPQARVLQSPSASAAGKSSPGSVPNPAALEPVSPTSRGRWATQALVVSVGQQLSSKGAARTATLFFRRNLL